MSLTRELILTRRYNEIQKTFRDLAPLWLINDTYRSRDDSFYFDVIYCHPVHGWIKQHIRYDIFNNVLYHLGETRVTEQAVLPFQEQVPFVAGSGLAITPNNPANRF